MKSLWLGGAKVLKQQASPRGMCGMSDRLRKRMRHKEAANGQCFLDMSFMPDTPGEMEQEHSDEH